MVDRLNFFDLYGYLIPGLVLVLVLGLPYGLVASDLVNLDLGSGIVAIVVAYVLGQQLYGLAEPPPTATVPARGTPRPRIRRPRTARAAPTGGGRRAAGPGRRGVHAGAGWLEGRGVATDAIDEAC